MSTGNQNLDLLIKLLGQTTNDNDNIALQAIRAANRQVDKFKTTWEDLLRGRVTMVADPFSALDGRPEGSTVRSTQAPAANIRRPTPPPPPRPQPPQQPAQDYSYMGARPQPAPRPQAPRPQAPISAAGQPNKFRGRCHKCGKALDSYQGILGVKSSITDRWKIECNPGQCLPNPVRPKGRDAKNTDRLTDLL